MVLRLVFICKLSGKTEVFLYKRGCPLGQPLLQKTIIITYCLITRTDLVLAPWLTITL